MRALDFEYDGFRLSDFGCIICTFDDPGTESYSIGSQITYNTVPVDSGKKNYLTDTKYDECINAEFQICKNVERLMDNSDKYFTVEEQGEIARWLNRRKFLPLIIMNEGYENIYFEASFNLQKYEVANNVVGFTLELTTNKPFALRRQYSYRFEITDPAKQTINDEIGYEYANLEILCNSNGTLTISNDMDNRVTEIRNCKSGEIITISNDLMIETSLEAHKSTIMNDFNFVFPRISNKFEDRSNRLKFSLPCKVLLSYDPVRKVGI